MKQQQQAGPDGPFFEIPAQLDQESVPDNPRANTSTDADLVSPTR